MSFTGLNLYDLFLIDVEGNVVYSVYKERDFATNLQTGPFRDSGLGEVFRSALNGSVGETYFQDYSSYEPSAGAPAAFLASQIADENGTVLGVLAVQLPNGEITRLATRSQGLGRTGDIILFGDDMRARSGSRFDNLHGVFDPITTNPIVADIGDVDVVEYSDGPNVNGVPAIGVARSIDFHSEHWTILGELELDEVYEAAARQRNKVLFVTTIAMMIVGVCGWFISRSFTHPLTQQRFAVDELKAGLLRLAQQDFSLPLNRQFAAEYEPLRENFNQIVENLGQTMDRKSGLYPGRNRRGAGSDNP